MGNELDVAVRRLVELRQIAGRTKEDVAAIDVLIAASEIGQKRAAKMQEMADAYEMLSEADAEVRALAVAAYERDASSKRPHRNVGIAVTRKVVGYDKAQAVEWLDKNMPILVSREPVINEQKFKKAFLDGLAAECPSVVWIDEVGARIDAVIELEDMPDAATN